MTTLVIHGHMQPGNQPTSNVAGRFDMCQHASLDSTELTPISEHHTQVSNCDVPGQPQSIVRWVICTTSGRDAGRRHGQQKYPKARVLVLFHI
jgi:hypothetical protein